MTRKEIMYFLKLLINQEAVTVRPITAMYTTVMHNGNDKAIHIHMVHIIESKGKCKIPVRTFNTLLPSMDRSVRHFLLFFLLIF